MSSQSNQNQINQSINNLTHSISTFHIWSWWWLKIRFMKEIIKFQLLFIIIIVTNLRNDCQSFDNWCWSSILKWNKFSFILFFDCWYRNKYISIISIDVSFLTFLILFCWRKNWHNLSSISVYVCINCFVGKQNSIINCRISYDD